ncbi:MAG: hypothetical protein VYD54_08075, partial [Bdellovibrionota bacterium]|nr:hypothetical protein [Bdellovibrionota bacterium]
SIKSLFEILEDFVSPLSDTYTSDHFHKKLKNTLSEIIKNVEHLKFLKSKMLNRMIEQETFEFHNDQVNPQVLATSSTCDSLETLLKYASCVDRFVPVDLSFNISVTYIILEKIEDMEKIFKNLFEYVFLVREIDKIDEEKLQKVVQVAKLYPEFERTIDLIQQRSRLLSFLLKGVGEEELSRSYQNLSSKVKIMPERARLTEFIIENNLIEPYKVILAKTKNIKTVLVLRIDERKKQFLNDKDYLLLLNELINRFIRESKEGPNQALPSLPKLTNINFNTFETFGRVIELKMEKPLEEIKKEFIEDIIYKVETMIRKIFQKELIQAKALPVEKKNKKYIKFIKDYLPKWPST